MVAPSLRALRALPALCLLSIALASALAPTAAAGDETCRQPPSSATIASFGSGTVTAQTQVGNVGANTNAGNQGIVLSSRGNITVTIDYQCIQSYTLVFEKLGPTGAGIKAGAAFYRPSCVTGSATHTFHVGLDAGEYQLRLKWAGCFGAGEERVRFTVVDPPLPLL